MAKFNRGDIVVGNHGAHAYRYTTPGTEWVVLGYNPVGSLMLSRELDASSDITYEVYEKDFDLVQQASKTAAKVKVDFKSVVIDDDKRQQILDALEQINQSELIFETWGFGKIFEKGRGVAMLFYGPPGTGKTLMGQAIADKLGKKLKIVSTADVESPMPGEAERNIRKHFKEAKKDILLFDECDSLIYSRSGVGAILGAQINELLSQIERHDGITIFTTNRLGTLDEAFNRRLALKLEFAMPSQDERVKIWKRMFHKKAPLAKDVDWNKLASIEMSGGYIKNAVLRAARMAAAQDMPDDEKRITMQHLAKATKYEGLSMIEYENARHSHQNRGFAKLENGKLIQKES